ncbi:hypothetical protein NDU88_005939 [Pleurodeles waltl]|uniref:Uncharacterized protein n=1 Tax=Pleurodeles waltl TaxID=8319 RepID=A0AAV7LPA3_PLEWA|nr:hypothetical protein NDU88_005939 [Pleurodeles waltl]
MALILGSFAYFKAPSSAELSGLGISGAHAFSQGHHISPSCRPRGSPHPSSLGPPPVVQGCGAASGDQLLSRARDPRRKDPKQRHGSGHRRGRDAPDAAAHRQERAEMRNVVLTGELARKVADEMYHPPDMM